MPSATDDPVNLLPHRPPFRFVDVVDELDPGRLAVARWRITGEEAFLAGHFPGIRSCPGCCSSRRSPRPAGSRSSPTRYAGSLPLFGGVEEVRFRRVVRPGDELVLRVEMERLSARGGWGRGVATVDDAVACRARLLFAIACPAAPRTAGPGAFVHRCDTDQASRSDCGRGDGCCSRARSRAGGGPGARRRRSRAGGPPPRAPPPSPT